MKVAVVDWDVPYPADSGKRLRTLNLMLALAERHELTHVSRVAADGPEGKAAAEFLRDHGVTPVLAGFPVAAKRGARYAARLVKNLASADPYAVDAHRSPAFERFLRDHATRNRYDVWQCEWTPYVQMLADVPGVRTQLVAHNVDSLIWRRYAEADRNPLRRAYIRMQHRRFERFERAAFRATDRVVAVSDEDAALARSMFDVDNVDVVENGVDVEAFGAVRRAPRVAEMLFLGSLDWRPNTDALRVLLEEVLPRVRRGTPGATLAVVGRRPSDALRQAVDRAEGATLHADVPDVRPFLARAGVMGVPLRIGGGSRLKILEALAARVPVVASAVAAEGLRLVDGDDFVRADTPEAMATAVTQWFRDPAAAAASAEQGRQTVASRYGWDSLATKLEGSWLRAAGVPTTETAATP